MPYEPRLPDLLDDLAKRGGGQVDPGGEFSETVDNKVDARSHSRACQDQRAVANQTIQTIPPSDPLMALYPPEAVSPVSPVSDPFQESLTRLRTRRVALAMEVPGLDHPLIIAADDQQADELVADGFHRGAIWTLTELVELTRAPGMTHDSAVQTARLRQMFNATVVEIGPASRSAVQDQPSSAPAPPSEHEPDQGSLDLGLAPREFD